MRQRPVRQRPGSPHQSLRQSAGAALTKSRRPGGFGVRFSQCWGLDRPQSGTSTLGAGEHPLPGCHTATLSLCPHVMGSRAQLSVGGRSFIRAAVPSVSHSPRMTQSLLQAPLPNTVIANWPQQRNLRGTYAFGPLYLLSFLSRRKKKKRSHQSWVLSLPSP